MFICCTDDSVISVYHPLTLVVGKMKGPGARRDEMVFGMHPLPLPSSIHFPTDDLLSSLEEWHTDTMDESVTYTHTLLNQQYQQQNELNGPANAPPDDVEVSTVGSSSHSHIPSSKLSQYSSIPSSTYVVLP